MKYHPTGFLEITTQKTYGIKQVYETYNESLLSEILLLLQIMEDRSLFRGLRNNERLQEIIDSMDISTLTYFRSGGRQNDKLSMLRHLRNSITHGNYLITPEGKMFVYDGNVRNDAGLEYKFSLDVRDLETVKDVLFELVAGHYPSMSLNGEPNQNQQISMKNHACEMSS